MAVDDASVSRLSCYAKSILNRLNSTRLFHTDGSRPRDWRGLAGLIGLSRQEAETCATATEVLQEWVRRDPRNAVVHQLFRLLETIDRYDIRDDLIALAVDDRLVIPTAEVTPPAPGLAMARQNSILTDDDMIEGKPVLYDAVILYADAPQDRAFVDALSRVLTEIGFRLFHKHSLRPGLMETAAVTELMSTRCRYTILVFSPAFLRNLDQTVKFYSEYAQAHDVAQNKHQMIPCVLEECQIPILFKPYSNINFKDTNFWRRLLVTLNYDYYERKPMLNIKNWLTTLGASNIQTIQSANVLPLDSNMIMGTPSTVRAANASGANSQRVHGYFSGHSNLDVANDRSYQPSTSNTNSVPGSSVHSWGFVNNGPDNSSTYNGQVANMSVANGRITSSSTSNHLVNSHFGNEMANNNANRYFRSQSTVYPNVRIANASESFTSSHLSSDSATSGTSGQNTSKDNKSQMKMFNCSFTAQSQVSNEPVADSLASSVANCLSSSGFIANQNEATASTSNAKTVSVIKVPSNRNIPNGQVSNGEITNGRSDESSNEYVVNIRVTSEPIHAPYAAVPAAGQSSQSNTSSNGLSNDTNPPSAEIQRSMFKYFSQLWRTRSWAIRRRISQNPAKR